ncbi:MAG: serine protease [Pseudomonadota bacterium]|nr:serine protease [Pseudomonadota bacterium]
MRAGGGVLPVVLVLCMLSSFATAAPLDLRDLDGDVQQSLMAVCKVDNGRIQKRHLPCLGHHAGAWRRLTFQPAIGKFNDGDQHALRKACEDMLARGPAPWARCIEQEMVRLKVPVEFPDLSMLKDDERDMARDECGQAAEVSPYREAACLEALRDRMVAERESVEAADSKDVASAIRMTMPKTGQPEGVGAGTDGSIMRAATEPSTVGRTVPSVDPRALTQGAVSYAALDSGSDFWPAWTATGATRPSALNRGAIEGYEVFDRVAASIYVILAADTAEDFRATRNVRQGSAVAVAADRLVTNCHTLKDAEVMVILQGTTHGEAELISADPGTDRCVVRSTELQLSPVAGVRDYSDIRMAERVYAISAPRGLQQTMQDGIVSQLRTNNGMRLIQTSAYAAPGSSGGGLFDAWGNLIGVTNFVVGGDDRLHFAIAAEEYWKK